MPQASPEKETRSLVARLFAPRLNRWFLPRLVLVTLSAYLFFGQVCLPAVTRGSSMVPTYADGQLLFCWRPKVWFGTLERGDVVMVRFSGRRVMLLKRIVALGGETVAFSEGRLLVNGSVLDEPYVKTACDWELEPREVPPGQVYVIGDNRGTPMETHQFGSVARERIVGVPLW